MNPTIKGKTRQTALPAPRPSGSLSNSKAFQSQSKALRRYIYNAEAAFDFTSILTICKLLPPSR